MTDRRRGGGWLASSAPPRPRGHRDAYSLEDAGGFTRHNFNANVSDYMLTSTYWPAWKAAVQEGKAKGVMCSCEIIDYDHCVHTRLRGGGRWPWAIGHHKNWLRFPYVFTLVRSHDLPPHPYVRGGGSAQCGLWRSQAAFDEASALMALQAQVERVVAREVRA
jgi:hypothetical protein